MHKTIDFMATHSDFVEKTPSRVHKRFKRVTDGRLERVTFGASLTVTVGYTAKMTMNDDLNQSRRVVKTWLVFKQSLAFHARRFEIALLIGLVLIGPIMAFSYYSLRQLDEARKVQEHSLVVREHLNDLRSAVRQYEIHALREDPEEEKGESRREVEKVLNDLSLSVEADEIQTESLTEVRAAIGEFFIEPDEARAREVREWIASMDAQEAEYLNEHRPAALTFLSTASGSILLVGILSLFLSILAFLGLRRQMRSREIIEDELRAAERQATRASEMKSKFLATISHEIRTPLNGIIAMADVLRMSSLPQSEKRLTDVIFQSSQSLLRIINDLLNFSQIESGQVGLEVKKFSVRTLLEQTCSVLDLKAQSKDLVIRSTVDAGVPERLLGDGGRLAQVLFNLIGNAIKFTEKGIVEVKAELDPSSDTDVARINFSVVDTGRGIASSDFETLFQPFNRLGQVGTSGEPGTGLGLSIAQSFVRQMGGEIRVESRIGEGSVFWFQLPFKRVQPGEVDAHEGSTTETGASPAPVRREGLAQFADLRVLVVEDNPTNQIVAETSLQQLGCNVTLADSGLQALDLIRSREFDLVFMDCQMPELDGYETTRRIRRAEHGSLKQPLRIVAMTANAQADDRARCLVSGMDDYVRKPFVIEDLVRALSDGEFDADLRSIRSATADLQKRLGRSALGRIRVAFSKSLEEWPLESHPRSQEFEYLRDTAHRLKSSAKTFGANRFSDRLERLELTIKNGKAETSPEIAVLKSEIDRDVRSLKRLFSSHLENSA